jgi:hypothetical protein
MWVTKYALTQGIRLCACEPTSFPDYVSATWPGGGRAFVKVGVAAFEDETDANTKAMEMCRRKIASMHKARGKVEDMMRHYAPKARQ